MLNIIWLGIIMISVVFGIITGRVHEVVLSVTSSAKLAFDIAMSMAGMMTLWLGIMQIAQDSGLVKTITRVISPLLKRLFPDIPLNHPAFGAITLNITANILGLANAATPFGIKAMEELEKLNPFPGEATNAMCMFTVINTSSVQLIPVSAIAFLSAAGASNPTSIIFSGFLATICSTIAGISMAFLMQKSAKYTRKIENASS
jgi:spore maturation protein A